MRMTQAEFVRGLKAGALAAEKLSPKMRAAFEEWSAPPELRSPPPLETFRLVLTRTETILASLRGDSAAKPDADSQKTENAAREALDWLDRLRWPEPLRRQLGVLNDLPTFEKACVLLDKASRATGGGSRFLMDAWSAMGTLLRYSDLNLNDILIVTGQESYSEGIRAGVEAILRQDAVSGGWSLQYGFDLNQRWKACRITLPGDPSDSDSDNERVIPSERLGALAYDDQENRWVLPEEIPTDETPLA